MEVAVYNISGKETGKKVVLDEKVFGVEPNDHAIYLAVKQYNANQRQGTQSAKTRAEVRGGGKKPFRQKGTGRARQGTTRAPHYVGGGVAFAPKPRDYSYALPRKVKRLALKSALSSKVNNAEIIIVDELQMDAPKTKDMVNILTNVKAGRKTLIVTADKNDNVVFSARNIEGVNITNVGQINVYEVLNSGTCLITKEAIMKLEEVYA